jgi:hypothetical protein
MKGDTTIKITIDPLAVSIVIVVIALCIFLLKMVK